MDITMTEVKHRIVKTNGIRMHVAEQGAGPGLSSVTAFLSPGTLGAASFTSQHRMNNLHSFDT
jgi:hypothetical protein